MQQTFLAGASLLTSEQILSQHPHKNESTAGVAAPKTGAEQPFHLPYAIHDGMFKNHAGDNFIDQIKFAYDMGFRAIEDNGMMRRTPEQQKQIGDTLATLGMRMGVFVISFGGWQNTLTANKKEWNDLFLKDCHDALEVAKRCNATWMTVVPGNYEKSLSHDLQTANVIMAMHRAMEIFEPAKLVVVLEALSDTPDLFLRHSEQAFMVCKAVNSLSCKILFDMYHMQRNEGDIINHITRTWDEIGYLQIGDNPGRKEPGTGEMNYKNIFKHIYNKGYKGVLGMEHGTSSPGKEGEMALIKAYRDSDNFM